MRASLGICLAILLAGCGGSGSTAPPAPSAASPPASRTCTPAVDGFRTCDHGAVGSSIERRAADGQWVGLAEALTHGGKESLGHWRAVHPSPDAKTLLAQWSGECEIPIAFFLPANGGAPRPVTGEREWHKAPESIAVGWSRDGRARVHLLRGACGIAAQRPGTYLIDPASGRVTYERPLPKRYRPAP
jgi:hypothetical protein